MPDPEYTGESKALHVESDSVGASPVTDGPVNDSPSYLGRTPMFRVFPEAPTWDLQEHVTGPMYEGPHYKGMSQAIHVRGIVTPLTPPGPVPACRCCAEEGSGSDCTPSGGTYEDIDDFNRTTSSPLGGWGPASSGPTWSGDGATKYVDGSSGQLSSTGSSPTNAETQGLTLPLGARLTIPFVLKVDLSSSVVGGAGLGPQALFAFDSAGGSFGGAFYFHTNVGDGQRSYLRGAAGSIWDTTDWAVPFASGVLTMEFDETGIAANGLTDPWRNPFSGDPVTCPTGTEFNVLSFGVYQGSAVGVNNVSGKDHVNWGQFCTDGPAVGDCSDCVTEGVPSGDWDPDAEYLVEYQDFGGDDGAAPGFINPEVAVSSDKLQWNGSVVPDMPNNDGYTILEARLSTLPADWPNLALVSGILDLYYEFTQDADHVVGNSRGDLPENNFDVDEIKQHQFGAFWLHFASSFFTSQRVFWWFQDGSGPTFPDGPVWSVFVSHPGGSSSIPFLMPVFAADSAGVRFSVRVALNVAEPLTQNRFKIKVWRTNEDEEPATWHVVAPSVSVPLAGLQSVRSFAYDTGVGSGIQTTEGSPLNIPGKDYHYLFHLESHTFGTRLVENIRINDVLMGGAASACGEPDTSNVWDDFDDRTLTTSPDWGDTSRDAIVYSIRTNGGGLVGPLGPLETRYAIVEGGTGKLGKLYSNGGVEGVYARVTSGPFIGTTHWTAVVKFMFPSANAPSLEGPATASAEELAIRIASSSPSVEGDDIVASVGVGTIGAGNVVAGTWYRAKYEWDGIVGFKRYRVWQDGTNEPATWDFNSSFAAGKTISRLSVGLVTAGTSADVFTRDAEMWVDWIDFDGDGPIGGGAQCDPCVDPLTGLDIPDFTPGFLPTFRKQIGDPTTSLDSFICTLESAAMVLDWHTRGAISVWGGELIPWCGKTTAQIAATGSNLSNAAQAWAHYGQTLSVRTGQSFNAMLACLAEGRAVILQGDYGVFSNAIKCQDSFEGNHAISVYPYQTADRLLVGDPLCSTFYGVPIAALQAYAEALGSPGSIFFAVSRPWSPAP